LSIYDKLYEKQVEYINKKLKDKHIDKRYVDKELLEYLKDK